MKITIFGWRSPPLETLFDEFSSLLSFGVSRDTLRESIRAPRTPPGSEDISVLVFANGVARQGAEVYVASYDFNGVLAPARDLGRKLKPAGFSIAPLPPSEIETKYFRDAGLDLRVVMSNRAISQLQKAAPPTNSSYPVIVFETGVKSGNAVFDAGVGVVRKEYFIPLSLPPEYAAIAGNFKAVPVIKVSSLGDSSAVKQLKSSFRQFGTTRLAVTEESAPYSPLIVSTYGAKPNYIFRADLDFLFHQTDSAFAHAPGNYVPVAQRSPRVSITK